MKIKIVVLLLALSIFSHCSRKSNNRLTDKDFRQTEEALVGANRMLVQRDKEKIQEYIKQNNLEMQESESGLWFGILKEGTGRQVSLNVLVTLDYEVSLLDGTRCYSSDSLGQKQFVTGNGGVESGLEEGVLMLKEGSEALFIMPPHLAHGLQGDGDRIPARSVIVYHINLLRVDE